MNIFIPTSLIFWHCSKIRRFNSDDIFYHKLGKGVCKQEVGGKYILHEVTVGNGQKLIQFAQKNDTFEVSTKYDDRETGK